MEWGIEIRRVIRDRVDAALSISFPPFEDDDEMTVCRRLPAPICLFLFDFSWSFLFSPSLTQIMGTDILI